MVSGYNSSTAFTTPDPSCAGREGDTWSIPTGPAHALRAAGLQVFTAPVHRGTDPQLAPCAPDAAPVPPAADEIDSFGDNDANGAALAGFLDFLRTQYGVERVQLIAHSDGGNWSRGAMTQSAAFAGLDVRSLSTLGTPYTGSMVADLGTELNHAKCDFSDRIEQDACEALLKVIQLIYHGVGPTAVAQLTHSYLEGWNAQQSIGSCPVTTIAGTGLDIPLVPFTFYNPSDGLVGEASALAHTAFALPSFLPIPAPSIPGLRSGGTFPVVHAPSLGFISPANLLNTPAISDDVTEIVTGTPSAGPLCNGAAAPTSAAPASQRIVMPLREQVVPSRSGGLGAVSRGDVVVARPGTRLRCGRAELTQLPLLGDPRLSIAVPDGCDGRVRAAGQGKARRRALLVRADPDRDVVARVTGDAIHVRVRGRRARSLRVKVAGGARLHVGNDGMATLPADAAGGTLLVWARGGGARLTGAAVLPPG